MANSTKPYHRSMSLTFGSGTKSLFGGSGKRYYTLVYKNQNDGHAAGYSEQIIVDSAELGRDPKCQIRIDQHFETVSRRHAVIVKEGEQWKIVHLGINPTIVNGQPLTYSGQMKYLQNGDEIQLSINGPKFGFVIPEGKSGLVSSIGLSRRLELFRKQAMRPYKQALTVLLCLFVACVSFGGYEMHKIGKKNRNIEIAMGNMKQERDDMLHIIDSLAHTISSLLNNGEAFEKEIDRLKNRISEFETQVQNIVVSPEPQPVAGTINNPAIDSCVPHIFYIQTIGYEITFEDGSVSQVACSNEDTSVPQWSGTGFMLSDGRFVTARHVIEAWSFWLDGEGVKDNLLYFNMISNNGGRVVAYFIAVSSSGQQMTFTSDQFECDRSRDDVVISEDGKRCSLARLDDTDYAYFQTNQRGNGLKYDSSKSRNLSRGTNLTILGFPLGLGANAIDDICPIYGNAITAANGLQQGYILTTDTNYEQGNSGGPVFYTNENNELEVIGIVSAGAGRSIGFVVPICVIN